ncbi:phosphoglycerate kinase [Candidatus Bathyarchaeota archaeon]|nr:phosphoglycerate kinase [Candidatus Bathyarchaeota archaeon]
MSKIPTLDDFNFKGKTVLVRPDFNVPIDPATKEIVDDTRIRAHAETIRELCEKGAKVVVIAHQGRPGEPDYVESLRKHAEKLGEALGKAVKYVDDLFGEEAKKAIRELKPGEVLVLKNVRSFPEETKRRSPQEHAKSEFVRELAPFIDVFVLDAFSVAHRSHASIVGFAPLKPVCAGRVMERELRALSKVLENPEKPMVCILGGAKAEKAVGIIGYMLSKGVADKILTGGLVGQLFLMAKGIELGDVNVELLKRRRLYDMAPEAKRLLSEYGEMIETPVDVALDVDGKRVEIKVSELPSEKPVSDIGSETASLYANALSGANSILVSGPLGVYEKTAFIEGTRKVFEAVAASGAYTVAGGGDTAAVLRRLGLYDRFSYVSLAGGAFIEYITGAKLPGVEVLLGRL